jgi:two-component system, LytTR family, sensor kinase
METSPGRAVWSRVRAFPWGAIALLFTALGVLQFFYHALDPIARGNRVDWLRVLAEELTGAWAGLAITPLVAWVTLSYPLREGGWKRWWPVYLATGVGGGFLDTSIIYALRIALFEAMGRGLYDYGIMRVRYFMELPGQLTAIGTIVLAISYSEHRRLFREREARIQALEQQVVQAQLETLQMQLQPHFLFNALNAISSMVYEDPGAADRMIGALSDFLRRVLRADKTLEVPLHQEMEMLDLYLRVMRARFEGKLECTVTASANLDDALVPQLILQPLVENALRYAADPETGHIAVAVEAKRGGEVLYLEIRDRGPGNALAQSGNGVGLSNLAGRLERLYGDAAQLRVEHSPGVGTNVLVAVPYHTEPLAIEAKPPAMDAKARAIQTKPQAL